MNKQNQTHKHREKLMGARVGRLGCWVERGRDGEVQTGPCGTVAGVRPSTGAGSPIPQPVCAAPGVPDSPGITVFAS